MQLLIMQSYPFPSYFVPLRPKYLLQTKFPNILSLFDVCMTVHRRHYVRKKPTRCDKMLILFTEHVSGTIMPIIRSKNLEAACVVKCWLLYVCTARKMWSDCPTVGLSDLIFRAVHTYNSQHFTTQAASSFVLLMMGIMVPETC